VISSTSGVELDCGPFAYSIEDDNSISEYVTSANFELLAADIPKEKIGIYQMVLKATLTVFTSVSAAQTNFVLQVELCVPLSIKSDSIPTD
jgi:hypothetical protein